MARWKEYSYTAFWGGDQHIYRPVISIELSNPETGKIFPCQALVDSGTDNIAIDSEVAAILGIDLSTCIKGKIGGVGEQVAYKYDKLAIAIPSLAAGVVPVVFTEKLPFSVLLGQKWFFEVCDIRFERRRNKFFLSKNSVKGKRKRLR